MAFDTTKFVAALKTRYKQPLRDILNNSRVLFNRLDRNSEDVDGNDVKCALRVGRNESGVGAIGRGGKLPIAGQQEYANTTTTTKRNYMRFEIDGEAMAESRTEIGSFIRALEGEMVNGADDAVHDCNRQVFGNGSGVLCNILSVTGAPTYTTKEAGGYANGSSGSLYLRVGMRVVAINPATGAVRGAAAQITAVDQSTPSFTCDGSLGSAANNDHIVKCSALTGTTPAAADTAYNNELMGLAGIVSDADPPTYSAGLQGVTVASNAWWKATVLANGGTPRALSALLLQQSFDQLELDSNNVPSMLLSGHLHRRQYFDLLDDAKRFSGDSLYDLDGGWSALSFNGVPWVVDKDCPTGFMYGIGEEDLEFFEKGDWSWMQADGAVLDRVTGYDAYEAVLFWYSELATHNRRNGLLLDDLST